MFFLVLLQSFPFIPNPASPLVSTGGPGAPWVLGQRCLSPPRNMCLAKVLRFAFNCLLSGSSTHQHLRLSPAKWSLQPQAPVVEQEPPKHPLCCNTVGVPPNWGHIFGEGLLACPVPRMAGTSRHTSPPAHCCPRCHPAGWDIPELPWEIPVR